MAIGLFGKSVRGTSAEKDLGSPVDGDNVPDVEGGRDRKMSRIGAPVSGTSASDSDLAISIEKQMELEANNSIKYRTCSWQKASQASASCQFCAQCPSADHCTLALASLNVADPVGIQTAALLFSEYICLASKSAARPDLLTEPPCKVHFIQMWSASVHEILEPLQQGCQGVGRFLTKNAELIPSHVISCIICHSRLGPWRYPHRRCRGIVG